MKKKILLPTDFSKNARSAASYAIEMFKNEDAQFILLNTFSIPFDAENSLVYINDLLQEESTKNLKLERNFLLKKYQLQAKQIKQKSQIGLLSMVINETIISDKITLVVMGTKGASGLKKMFVGSNTVRALRRVNCPVIVVPEGSVYKPLQLAVAIDFKPIISPNVFLPLKQLIQNRSSKIFLINILAEDEFNTTKVRSVESVIKSVLNKRTVEFDYIEDGDIIHGLNQFISNKKINMLVMIAHQYPFIKMLFHNSITKEMSMISRIPLLIIKDQLN